MNWEEGTPSVQGPLLGRNRELRRCWEKSRTAMAQRATQSDETRAQVQLM